MGYSSIPMLCAANAKFELSIVCLSFNDSMTTLALNSLLNFLRFGNIKLFFLKLIITILTLCPKIGKYYTQIRTSFLISEIKDTSYIPQLFKNIYDQRITHDYRYLGMSIYQSKIYAIQEMSGIKAPKGITRNVDFTIITFYRNWAIKKGYKITN